MLTAHMMNILFISLEYATGAFSGNGIYAQSQVRGLRQIGHNVVVVAGKPDGEQSVVHDGHVIEVSRSQTTSFILVYYIKPKPQVDVGHWGRLDSSAPWADFRDAVDSLAGYEKFREFQPDAVLVVDWSALVSSPAVSLLAWCCTKHSTTASFLDACLQPAWQRLRSGRGWEKVPMFYLNYRVFTRTETDEGLKLVKSLEQQAMADAQDTVVLSRADSQYLQANVAPAHLATYSPHVILCALRGDMLSLPLPADVHAPTTAALPPGAGQCSNGGDNSKESKSISNRPYIT